MSTSFIEVVLVETTYLPSMADIVYPVKSKQKQFSIMTLILQT
jgi:hypothetical protein